MCQWDKVFDIEGVEEFEAAALDTFTYQYKHCEVYGNFCKALGKTPKNVQALQNIPFLPISFFKSHKIYGANTPEELVFTSSGTTGMVQSRHYVAHADLYRESFLRCFDLFYGRLEEYTVLALLPAYSEREGSSLIYMVDEMIRRTKSNGSGYFLYNHAELYQTLLKLKEGCKKVILFGVSYALLDFIEEYNPGFDELVVMETGGMKGRRKELLKSELHEILKNGFGTGGIHSEYGMTELLSQAYSTGNERFNTPSWMKVLLRDVNDPLGYVPQGRPGGINVIDLANRYSCSFIATQDLGVGYEDGSFSVTGRFDYSDIRGCNLLIA